ncbi:Tfp pilus assembly protein PilW [Moraxella caprae]|uniref:Tfp pilus assembly protein PilW n=1 Tax=Moraxella caprae TaxID=90240 RepID=A0A378QXQ1_9GAMM|nr:prepilin-type N-terminal cleavage/methylation domain-containing protein [Moraxella caprae]STZ07548.1 Tfp pilus assembly protein PilW [Moraxella caprae]
MINKQQGFTLIELMISLVLGLLIIAAVGQVYVISVRTATVQEAGSSILDANVFGLQHIENNRLPAKLGFPFTPSLLSGGGKPLWFDKLTTNGFPYFWVLQEV